MIKYIRNAVACAFGFVTLALASGCNPGTSVRVVQDGVPVAGAEVFASNRDAATGRQFQTRIGLTDASGVLALPSGVAQNTALVARKLKFERPGWRPHHNPDGGANHEGVSWTERVYITSMDVNAEGVLSPLVVTAPAAQQTLELSSDRTLIGLHFLVSVIWDASDAELVQIGNKFRDAGDYMYNASDGQIYFEQVDVVDDHAFWGDAEYHWNADLLSTWPNCWSLRGLFVPNFFGSVVEMSRRPDQFASDPITIAHEFGHLAFGLMDEYMIGDVFCATHLHDTPSDPNFGSGMPKASCVMFAQWEGTKYCSNHIDNPHPRGTGSLQADNCWHAIASALADTNTPAQWTIQTPDTRGFIVGRLPPGSSARWQPRIVIDNKVSTFGLPCQPFNVTATWPDGTTAGANWRVTMAVDMDSRRLDEGPTSNGSVMIVGAHPGDRIWIGNLGPWRNVVATPSAGPNTCEAP